MLSIKQLSAYWWTSDEKILTWVANGVIPAPATLGGLVRWRRSVLDQWEADSFPRQPKPPETELDAILVAIHNERV